LLPNMFRATSIAPETMLVDRLFNHLSRSNEKAHRERDFSAIRVQPLVRDYKILFVFIAYHLDKRKHRISVLHFMLYVF
jgi:hypothetical protein